MPNSPIEIERWKCATGTAIASVIKLSRLERPAQGDTPMLTSDSVVLATGGGRGVTAVLCEELLSRFGCTVMALGRTDPATAPANILRMKCTATAGLRAGVL